MKADLYTPAVEQEMLDRIACGRGILEVCSDPDMPSEATVYRRMAKDEEFASRIARAREAQQEYEADNIVALADQATVEDHQVVKLRIWARQWRASKLAPKTYGDKIQQQHTDGEGKPLAHGPTIIFTGAPASAVAPQAMGSLPNPGD